MEVKWCIFRLGFLWKENEKGFIDRRENEEDERVRDLSKFVQTLKNGLYEWLGCRRGVRYMKRCVRKS